VNTHWNPCSSHEAPAPTKIELIARLITCAAALHLRAEKADGEYKPYFADRAQQCRSWAADLKEGHRIGDKTSSEGSTIRSSATVWL
jgi:hypothetical protein